MKQQIPMGEIKTELSTNDVGIAINGVFLFSCVINYPKAVFQQPINDVFGNLVYVCYTVF